MPPCFPPLAFQVQAVPVLDAACVQQGVATQQARDPRAEASDPSATVSTITTAVDWEGQHVPDDYNQSLMFKMGHIHPRSADTDVPTTVMGTADGFSARHELSIDGALFPFVHHGGRGHFTSGDSLSTLLRQRIQQLFSPFTLIKEYLLVMFQVR